MTTSSLSSPLSTTSAQGFERVRLIKPLLSTRASQPPALFLLYNLVRGRDLRRGFTPPRGRGVNTHLALRMAAERVLGVAKSLGVDLSEAERTALADLLRQVYLEDFEASCAAGPIQAPSVSRMLWNAMRITPHGTLPTGVLGHGMDCWKRYRNQAALLRQARAIEGAPRWLLQYGSQLLDRARPLWEMQEYLVNHDCGKPAVMQRDAQGRLHFPGHAEKSAQLWRMARRSEVAAQLMEQDMALHTLPVSAMAEFAKNYLAPSLLLAAQAQLFSNAATIFGGLDSASYRKKQAALDERAHALIAQWGLEPRLPV